MVDLVVGHVRMHRQADVAGTNIVGNRERVGRSAHEDRLTMEWCGIDLARKRDAPSIEQSPPDLRAVDPRV